MELRNDQSGTQKCCNTSLWHHLIPYHENFAIALLTPNYSIWSGIWESGVSVTGVYSSVCWATRGHAMQAFRAVWHTAQVSVWARKRVWVYLQQLQPEPSFCWEHNIRLLTAQPSILFNTHCLNPAASQTGTNKQIEKKPERWENKFIDIHTCFT